MGLTITCKKTGRSIDMGAFGFMRLRKTIAKLVGEPFYSHYCDLFESKNMIFPQKSFYDEYNAKTYEMVQSKKVDFKVAAFLYASDVNEKLPYGVCKNLLKVIGDYEDDTLYGYCGRPDCARFADFKDILPECVWTKSNLEWY